MKGTHSSNHSDRRVYGNAVRLKALLPFSGKVKATSLKHAVDRPYGIYLAAVFRFRSRDPAGPRLPNLPVGKVVAGRFGPNYL